MMKRNPGDERLTLREIAAQLRDDDSRSFAYLYHASIVGARELGIYERGRAYSAKEGRQIQQVIKRLFPSRGSD